MLDNDNLSRKAASFKRPVSRAFDKAIRELIDLAWKYRSFGADFLWEKDPELNDEAIRICRDLSDGLAEKARLIAASIMEDSLDYYDLDASWDREDGDDFIPIITRLDQQGSFLLELLEIWIALAFVNGIGKSELRVLVSRYLNNPFASPLWKGIPADALKWGRGFQRNILEQMTVIGQNSIISAARYAEWVDAMAKGAGYYIRRRGSGYDCQECDEMCGFPIPIEVPFEFLHSRCMCRPEYHFEEMPTI